MLIWNTWALVGTALKLAGLLNLPWIAVFGPMVVTALFGVAALGVLRLTKK